MPNSIIALASLIDIQNKEGLPVQETVMIFTTEEIEKFKANTAAPPIPSGPKQGVAKLRVL